MTPMIRGIQDNRILCESQTLQRILYSAKGLIQPFHHAIVAGQMLPGRTGKCPQIRRHVRICPIIVHIRRREAII